MRALFFFVHPSKYYLFRETIRKMEAQGHQVDIAIVTKDLLEELISRAGLNYENIVPEGRRSESLPRPVAFAYFSIRTLWQLYRFVADKQYDVFISDDLLVVLGRILRIPSLMFSDDNLSAVPEAGLLYRFATKVVSPRVCNLGKFEEKKIAYEGFHELAYLHPDYFQPDIEKTRQFNPEGDDYAILRLVSLTATHDAGKQGIGDRRLHDLISLLERKYKVYISAERPLAPEFEKYRIRINPLDIGHALRFAKIFIGDSQTMTTEAALLGTPSIRFNDFVGKVDTMEHLESHYGLTKGFRTDQFEQLLQKVKELMDTPDVKDVWEKRREKMLAETEDVNEVIYQAILKFNPAP